MTTTLDSLLHKVEEVAFTLEHLNAEIVIGPQQVTIVQGLSDIDENLGIVLAGEFRAGNGNVPGDSFSGVRIAYPGMTYNSEVWHIAGVNDDVLQFGLRASDGVALAGGGTVELGADGVQVTITTSFDPIRSYKFLDTDGTTVIGGLYMRRVPGFPVTIRGLLEVDTTFGSFLDIQVTTDGEDGSITQTVTNGTVTSTLEVGILTTTFITLTAKDITLSGAAQITGSLLLGGGLNLGTATAAITGQIFLDSATPVLDMLDTDAANDANNPAWRVRSIQTGFFHIQSTPDRSTYTSYLTINKTGAVFVGDSSDANLTVGLVLNQAGNDDNILSLKSSDVAHGMTTAMETDTYGSVRKYEAAGGLKIQGWHSSEVGLDLEGIGTTDDTGKATTANAYVQIRSFTKTGTTVTAPGANANLLVVCSAGTTRFILDADGDSHQDVGTAWTNFDAHNDADLLTELSVHVSRHDDPIRQELGAFLQTNRARLEALRLVTFNDDGHHFINMSRLTMLLVGAVRQVNDRLGRFEQTLLAMGADPTLLA
jgi:hypothetical protein